MTRVDISSLPQHLSTIEIDAIKYATARVAEEFDDLVLLIALFGSKSRGDYGPDSDVDILIVTEREQRDIREKVRVPTFDAIIEYGVHLSPRVIGLDRLERIASYQPSYFQNLRDDAIELWRRPGTENPFQLIPALA